MDVQQAKKLSDAYIEYKVNGKITWDSPLLLAVIRINEQIENEYSSEFAGFSNLSPEQLLTSFKGMFADEKINWGRIMIVYLLSGLIAKGKSEKQVLALKNSIGQFVAERCSDWIKNQGGWEELYGSIDDEEGEIDGSWKHMAGKKMSDVELFELLDFNNRDEMIREMLATVEDQNWRFDDISDEEHMQLLNFNSLPEMTREMIDTVDDDEWNPSEQPETNDNVESDQETPADEPPNENVPVSQFYVLDRTFVRENNTYNARETDYQITFRNLDGRDMFSIRENLQKTTVTSDPATLFSMLTDPSIIVNDINFFSENVAEIKHTFIDEKVPINKKGNVVLAAFTTAHARLKLYQVLEKLQRRVLYYDTDSIIFTVKPNEWEPPLGDYLGELTNEIDPKDGNHITQFVSGGLKIMRTNSIPERLYARLRVLRLIT
ncbi:uncharacterized protein LOC117100449 [Anneissia japonica]|uniref:uncharacterized protein LOC117100449 n=1 Tax=Anneissia japonica TaxID=1529436 RepID=UPI001425A312|nr:uncharacterized protein LOC117100449 [Anneissia japonica]